MKKIKGEGGILIKTIQIDSADLIYSGINNSREHLRKWLSFVDQTKSAGDTRKFIQSVLHSTCQKKDEIFEVWFHDEFAGLVGFKEIDHINRKVEIGYWLVKDMTGKGIINRSCQLLINHAFQKMNLNRIMIKVAKGNTKSIAVPIRLGFTFEGIERNGELLNGQFIDLEVYSLLKSDRS